MGNNIKFAFDQVHAKDSLKAKTKTALYDKTRGYRKKSAVKWKPLVITVACFFTILFGVGAYFSYTTPVAAISIDVNPSIELEVNLYDKVIHVEGYNEDGAYLAEELNHIVNMGYPDAINTILENEKITSLLNTDHLLEVTVASNSDTKSKEMQTCISNETNINPQDIYCSGNYDDVAAAHSVGLSFGKYRAFLELQKTNPDITVEDIQNLTMREIREQMENGTSSVSGSNSGNGGQGHRHGYGHGRNSGLNSQP